MVLVLFSASASAKVYDLYNPNVGICPGGVLEYKTNSYQYVCHTDNRWINFNVGDRIVWSGPTDKTVLLTVKKGMNFPGNNQVGTLASPISLHTVQATVMFVGPDIVVTGKTSVGPAGYHISAESNGVKLLGGVLNQSPNGFVSVRGSNNEIKGGLNAVGHIYLENVQVTGNIASSTNYVSVQGTGNQIDGNISAFDKVEINETKVNGNIESQGATVDITGTGNEVNGDIVALSYVRLNDTKVVGNVVSHGTQVETTGSSNEVYGDVTALQKINLHNTKVCGTVTSKGQAVKMTGTNNAVYDEHSAIDAWYDIDLSNALICGSLTSHLAPISTVNTSLHCGFNDLNCGYAPSNCPETSVRVCSGDSPPAAEKIEVNPRNYHLTCESTPENMVEVSVLDGDGNLLEGYRPTLSQDSGTNLDIQFVSEAGGISKFRVINNTPNTVGNYSLSASLKVSNTITLSDSDTIKYVPYKFEVSDQSVIAGKPIDVPIKVKACSNSGQLIDLGYVGSPSASYSYQKPVTASAFPSLLQFNADLTDSNRNARLTFQDAGQILVTITDNNFQCDEAYCPVEGGALKGQFMVQSRPWKFSVCPQNTEGEYVSANGNSKSGSAFVAAEQFFSVRVAPLKYNSPECSEQEQLTQNYFLSEASVELSHSLDSPSNGKLGTLNGTLARKVTENDQNTDGYIFSDLAYSEVGSIGLSALEVGVFYSSIEVDGDKGIKGSRKIGRFYPDSFVINSTKWDAPKNQGNISYMGQNFDLAEVSILPYGMGSGAPLKNYHLIDGGYQAKFVVLGDGKVSNSLILDTSLGDWRENPDVLETSQWYLQDAFAYVTKPLDENGPFNTSDRLSKATEFGLEISGKDPVRFYSSSSKSYSVSAVLPSQPPVRFGRMLLSDVGGYQGQKLTVPLSVEFWNGERFVTNEKDNNTSVINFIQKQTPIWPDDGTDCSVLLEGNATVSGGKTRKIKAQQDLATCQSAARQQTEVWLGLDSDGSNVPWLKYNWDKDSVGEENPSSVVTFGIHRGNDRVIYRGEPGLTGQ